MKKLTDDEREQRRKARNKKLFESYRTHSGHKGSPEQWRKAAELLLAGESKQSYLEALGLKSIPSTLEELTRSWKKAMLLAHPDKGGTNEQAMLINEAYDKMKWRFSNNTEIKKDTKDIIDPAKADHIEHENFNNLWKDPKYINESHIAEKKLDGSRYILYLDELSKLLSRRISSVTGEYVDKTDNCPHLTKVIIPKKFWGTVLDGEMVHPSCEKSDSTTSIMGCGAEEAVERQKKNGWLHFCVYDLPRISFRDIRKNTLKERKKELRALITELQKYIPVILHPDVPASHAKELYEKTISEEGEGIMLKDLNAPYGEGWYKVKKTVTWDVVIMGYEAPKRTSKKVDGTISETAYHQNGLIGSVRFGAYKNNKLVELGTCSGMSVTIRKELSTKGNTYIGKVIEIRFQERTKSGAFRHARFVKFREDKDASQCIDE